MSSSSSHNYMDNVPVKISEKYKPPPRIFQMPQAIANKLALPEDYYENAPQYAYDFQLERKALAKLPEWRRMRESEREARQERKARREQQRLRQAEQQQRRLLGAVSYPAEELSSSSSSDDETEAETTSPEENNGIAADPKLPVVAVNNFNDILQPTILRHDHSKQQNHAYDLQSFYKNNAEVRNGTGAAKHAENASTNCDENNKLKNVFNYKDFEEDTSSPFDSIALKAINDLDVLAQVLHNTQMNTAAVEKLQKLEAESNKQATKDCEENIPENLSKINEERESENNVDSELKGSEACDTLEQQQIKHANDNDYTAGNVIENSPVDHYQQATQHFQAATQTTAFQVQDSTNGLQKNNSNLNYLYYNNAVASPASTPQTYNTNFFYQDSQSYITPHWQHQQNFQNFQPNNANTMHASTNQPINSPSQAVFHTYSHYALSPNTNFIHDTQVPSAKSFGNAVVTSLDSSKSKSVPDILKELKDELHNSEMRRKRNRNYSVNNDDGKSDDDDDDNGGDSNQKDSLSNTNFKQISPKETNREMEEHCLVNLEDKARSLALNISSMGFPLQRVAKAFELFGTDDKRVIEHLIPLGELLDLGFDESKISEALVKFDNNKEKALEYLIT